jgi:hypothetical protein
MPNNQYSPGILDVAGLDPRISQLIRQLFDRVNWMAGEIERLQTSSLSLQASGSGSSNSPSISSSSALLPMGPDNLVSPAIAPGQVVGGTENWGANVIVIPAVTYSLSIDQANFRSLVFSHAVAGAKTITMPAIAGKMWLVLNGNSADQITFNPPGAGTGSTVAGLKNGIIVMNNLGGILTISKMAPDGP